MAMHCDCGHVLRTIEEQADGQCVRCSAKEELRNDTTGWIKAGSDAYHNDTGRAPLMNDDVMAAIRDGGDVLAICSDFLKGWDTANLAADW
ncbi:MAG: hypothetical protein ACYSQZ_09710 [Planctomycetota bacterium]|jgi:hypothetical protein